MKLAANQAVSVYLEWDAQTRRPVGRLAWRGRRAFFEYHVDFLADSLPLSPFHLPVRPGVIEASPSVFSGLFGVFDDSLPDGWGRLLQDRRARLAGLSPRELSPLDRLAWVGPNGLGALGYRPELLPASKVIQGVALDALAEQSQVLLSGAAADLLPELLRLGGSPHGARPKVLVGYRPEDGHVVSGTVIPSDHRTVLVKFTGAQEGDDAGAIELCYSRLAQEAGLVVPQSWLLPSARGAGWFAVERFDLVRGERVHTHTLSGLLNADHRLPSLDYVDALTAVHRLTQNHGEMMRLFRRAVFNVVAHNRDDHTKQTTLLMDREGEWTLSPAYDLTFSEGPGGEHCMAVAGEGHPKRADLLRLAERCGLPKRTATDVIEQVADVVVSRWKPLAERAGVSARSVRQIAKVIGF